MQTSKTKQKTEMLLCTGNIDFQMSFHIPSLIHDYFPQKKTLIYIIVIV